MSTINLLPEDYIKRRTQRRANILCAGLFGLIMSGVLGAAIVSERNTRNTERVRDRVNADYAQAAKLLGQIQQLEAQKRENINKAKATASLLERVPRSYVLATIAQALPENTSIDKLTLKTEKRKIRTTKAPAKRGKKKSKFNASKKKNQVEQPPEMVLTVEIVGFAATDVLVSRFITNLLGCPILESVNLDYTEEDVLRSKDKDVPDLHIREFKVTMELTSDVDVINFIEQPETEKDETEQVSDASVEIPEKDKAEPIGGAKS